MYIRIKYLLTTIEQQLKEKNISQQDIVKLLRIKENDFTQLPENSKKTKKGNKDTENHHIEFMQQPVAQFNESTFLSSIVAKITWSHHVILMDKEPHAGKRFWYMLNSLEYGISRNILSMQIESNLFGRQVETQKINNFKHTLPPAQSDFADYLLKDPYIFDFVQAKEKADERDIEEQLASHATKFLLELGKGFAFVGRQMHFQVGDSDFYADLVFYHIRLKCYVIVELKARPFKPGDTSQLNFYVNVANDLLKGEGDNNTIGLLCVKEKTMLWQNIACKECPMHWEFLITSCRR